MSDDTKEGSFLAVLRNGRHISHSSYYFRIEAFKDNVRAYLRDEIDNVVRFFYAWGRQSQEYTPNEVREVYFSE